MNPTPDLLDRLGDDIVARAVVLVMLAVITLRMAMPLIFGFRTRIQSALETTYTEHIAQLRKYIDELKGIIDEERGEKQELKEEVTGLSTEVKGLKRQMDLLIGFIRTYGCKRTPDCPNKEPVDFDVCDGCLEENCNTCSFA